MNRRPRQKLRRPPLPPLGPNHLKRGFGVQDEPCVKGRQQSDFGSFNLAIMTRKALVILASVPLAFGAIGSEAKSEWFRYGIRAVGTHIQFWINDKLVMTHDDAEYKAGRFAIQGHNPGMKIEAKELHYTDLSK